MTMSTAETGSGGAGRDEYVALSNEIVATTGRYIVVMSDNVRGDHAAMTNALRSVAGVTRIASTRDFQASALDAGQANMADATVFAELGIAVVAADPSRGISISAAAEDGRIAFMEPERVSSAITHPKSLSVDYLSGYRDAVVHLYEQTSEDKPGKTQVAETAPFADSLAFTWGLQATDVLASDYNGQGIAIAVLDTGLDLGHPDFTGRAITAQSFVPDEPPQDGYGHGTHCVGTSCGRANPSGGRRYGVASEASIFVGKVLNNQGSGVDANILAGINWAVANSCQVVSMSLGASLRTVSAAYEAAGQRALAAGTLIVAAAGNNARRAAGNPGFVGVPANSPSIMAVAAVDSAIGIASFSAQSSSVAGGQVDIAGPGVAVYSSWPTPEGYKTISGTSMATPHVAGIAALWSQATGSTGAGLWSELVKASKRLTLSSVDVGAGLVQAPKRSAASAATTLRPR